ncbi:MAG: DNA alkylation repair protein [Lachnospiraceae bacterium]|nr:DNA alkylation repair protein [Lachnospiraceae bacterium]
MIIDEIREELFRLQDTEYRDFQSRLIPSTEGASFIGVRTPALRDLAKRLAGREDIDLFLSDLPHTYFDENQLHAFVISAIRDYGACLEAVERFLPYVDNWATCDQMSPKVFRKHRGELTGPIRRWLGSGETYTVRFGMKMLMEHYLDEDFDPAYPEAVARIRSDEYYVRMMQAWYFATALAKQYDAAVKYLEERRLDVWTHNKTIQKAVESFRIGPKTKDYLRGLRIKGTK